MIRYVTLSVQCESALTLIITDSGKHKHLQFFNDVVITIYIILYTHNYNYIINYEYYNNYYCNFKFIKLLLLFFFFYSYLLLQSHVIYTHYKIE